MAQATVLEIDVTGYGQPAIARSFPFTFATSPLKIDSGFAFATGFQTITKPTGSKGVIIANLLAGATLTVKGVTGDTGFAIAAADAALFPICIPVATTLTVTASAGATCDMYWI